MKPLFGDQDYLEVQHVLISVIAKDGDNESYGNYLTHFLQNMYENTPRAGFRIQRITLSVNPYNPLPKRLVVLFV